VSVGTLAQLYKGHDVLIDAVARCRAAGLAVEATIVGDGAHRAALAARAADGVTFAGQLPAGAAVRAALDQADVFVLASRAEGLPRALIEAMARGLPGLATRVGGIPELLPEDRLVPPDDPAALAGAIAALCRRTTPFAALAHRDRDVARAYEASALRARRRAFYVRLRHAAERPLAEAG
jgi:glycosyltransferase involved in cell wall biosynthesis